MKYKLKLNKYNEIEISRNIVKFSKEELCLKALANIDIFYNTISHLLYNPQQMLFATAKLSYDKDISLYTDNQEEIYSKFENISKILSANIIMQLYKWFNLHLESDNMYIPSDFYGKEFDILFDTEIGMIHNGTHTLQIANGYIYTVAILKLYEEKIKNKKEYKDTIKKVLQVFVEEKQISEYNWKQVCKEFVNEEYYLPIGKLFFLLLFHGR